jgi:hypothetical protein
MALILETLATVWVEDALAWVLAKAPVRTRAITNARTMCFMARNSLFGTEFGTCCVISLDRPDKSTLGFLQI